MFAAGANAARGAARPAPAAPLRHRASRAPRAARAAPRAALGDVLLEVRGLEAKVAATGEAILKGVDLTLREGEVHVIMGKNGSGKSTLSKVLVGHPEYEVTGGSAAYKGGDLFALAPEARARAGLFLSFQVRVGCWGIRVLGVHPLPSLCNAAANAAAPRLTATPPSALSYFQSPVEVPGVSNVDFLRLATNERRKARGEAELDPLEFYAHVAPKVRRLFLWVVWGAA